MVQIAELKRGPYWKHIGMNPVTGVDGKIRVELELSENLLQVYGNLHGGVIASVLDSCIAVAINQSLEPGEGAVTLELKINYLRPVSKGKICGEGAVIKKGKIVIVAQGEIKDESGQLVAFGTATFMRNGI